MKTLSILIASAVFSLPAFANMNSEKPHHHNSKMFEKEQMQKNTASANNANLAIAKDAKNLKR